MKFTDAMMIDSKRRRDDGSLVVDARVARTGIQTYLGREVGKPELSSVKVFRGADEVFSEDSLKTFAYKPITVGHPTELVDAKNWKKHSVGMTSGEIAAKDIFVSVPLMVSDAAAINTVDAGTRELSVGYTCDLDFTPGTTENGETFDARQVNIRVNHIAIVPTGRAGPQCRIGDSWDEKPMKTVVIDRLPFQVDSDLLASAIEKLIADHEAVLQTVKDRDTTIGELKATAASVVAVDVDALVIARSELLTAAKSVMGDDFDPKGLTTADIHRAVVVKKHGEDFAKDASPEMLAGAFKVVTADAATADPFKKTVADATGKTPPAAGDFGQKAFEKSMADAWRDPSAWLGNA